MAAWTLWNLYFPKIGCMVAMETTQENSRSHILCIYVVRVSELIHMPTVPTV